MRAGALFEIGDGHAAQGDGEVDQTAIETSLRGRIQLTVRKDMKLKWPRAETATDYISMGTDPDLVTATKTAIQEMVDFLVSEKKLTRHQAYQLVSIAGNVAITQLVDKPNVGRARQAAEEHFRRQIVPAISAPQRLLIQTPPPFDGRAPAGAPWGSISTQDSQE